MPFALGRARRGPQTGLLHDAFVDGGFVLGLIEAVREGRTVAASPGEMRFVPTRAIENVTFDGTPEVRRLNVEQSNTSVIIGDYMVVKGYRRLEQGIHLELEVARFLTEKAGFSNTPPLLGAVEHVADDGGSTALCIIQGFVRNQGSGWDFHPPSPGADLRERGRAAIGHRSRNPGSQRGVLRAGRDARCADRRAAPRVRAEHRRSGVRSRADHGARICAPGPSRCAPSPTTP